MLETGGMFHFAWVIPALLGCIVGLLLYIPFIASFPRRQRIWLILSAAGFLAGALGMEMLAGTIAQDSAEAIRSSTYRVLANLEEGLEGGAVILFIAVLLRHGTDSRDLRSIFPERAKAGPTAAPAGAGARPRISPRA